MRALLITTALLAIPAAWLLVHSPTPDSPIAGALMLAGGAAIILSTKSSAIKEWLDELF